MLRSDLVEVKDSVMVQRATKRGKELGKIGLGKGIAKSVGKGQKASAFSEELENSAQFFWAKKGSRIRPPALVFCVIAAGRRRDDKHARFRQAIYERPMLSG